MFAFGRDESDWQIRYWFLGITRAKAGNSMCLGYLGAHHPLSYRARYLDRGVIIDKELQLSAPQDPSVARSHALNDLDLDLT